MRWPGTSVESLEAAVSAARAGQTRLVAVEAEAGYGKTTFLRQARTRLGDFVVLHSSGEESAGADPFQLLRELGMVDDRPLRHVLHAARALTAVVDRPEPVALVLDDMQWMDPESVAAVAALVQRSIGNRLLVLAAHRPLGTRHPAWRRLLDGLAEHATLITLTGLDREAAAELVADLVPDAPPGLAERLREHTGGSPLHLRALLREHPVHELSALAARGELPAPAELAAAIDARVGRLGEDASRLLHTLAVLDDGWTELLTAAAIGGIADPQAATAILREEQLLRLDRTDAVPRVRLAQGVVRAAAYETVPFDVRRRLHRAAAARLSEPGDRLRHRLAAAAGPDEGLAGDLDVHADGLHAGGRFREAARFRRLAASVSGTGEARDRRSLDADIEALLARDLDGVAASEPDTPHRRLVQGLRLTVEKRWLRAAETLDGDLDGLDALNAYRALVLRGWTIVASGRDPAAAMSPLTDAAAAAVQDPAFRAYFTFAYGEARRAAAQRNGELWGFEDSQAADRATLAATPEGLVRLSWRGSIYAVSGRPDRAIGDLAIVTDRIADGALDFGDGIFHALLGLAQWTGGQWRRASISIDLALSTPFGAAHPGALAIAPLRAVVTGGDVAGAMECSREARIAAPMRAAVYAGDIADIGALGFAGTPQQRRDWRTRRSEDLGDPRGQLEGALPYLWVLVQGLGAAWSGDAATVDAWADDLEGLDQGPWRPGGVAWLRALARQARGEPAASALHDAAARGLPGIPSFGALLWVDASTAAVREQHPAAADIRARAQSALGALGAAEHATRLLPDVRSADDPLTVLSGREREVVSLVLEGLSYAQIAKELYVTRSTVAFHLSRAYAKTGTRSRHELVQLVR
jgi:DNA-binding CsgD family transcriptional regulator